MGAHHLSFQIGPPIGQGPFLEKLQGQLQLVIAWLPAIDSEENRFEPRGRTVTGIIV